MRKILVPCDFSEPAVNAYRQALDVAAQSRGEIHLLHIIDQARTTDETGSEEKQRSKAETQFKNLIQGSKQEHLKTKFEIKLGSIADVIQDYIKANDIDLVIMGSTGASGLKEIFIGSNAEKVVRQSEVPVLIVKNYYGQPINRIVFPNTLEHQEDLVMKVKDLQHFFNAKLCLVYINTQFGLGNEAATHQHLQEYANRYMLTDYSINVFSNESIEKGIIEFTKMVSGDMIALGTHGHKGIVHLVKGSIAEDIVNHVGCPIWTYRMKDEVVEKQG